MRGNVPPVPKRDHATGNRARKSAEDGTPASDGNQYVKLISLTSDIGADRLIVQMAPNVEIVGGALATRVFGFDSSQLGAASELSLIHI